MVNEEHGPFVFKVIDINSQKDEETSSNEDMKIQGKYSFERFRVQVQQEEIDYMSFISSLQQ